MFGLEARQPSVSPPVPSSDTHREVINRYCISCHNGRLKTGGLALDTFVAADVAQNPEAWEKAVRKMRARQMPPVGLPRPDEATYQATIASLEQSLDRAAAAHPNPGRTDTLRRLNRTEYRNAIRDLLALDVDVASLLPADESSYGFDNVTVGGSVADICWIAISRRPRRSAVWRSDVRVDLPAAIRSGFQPDLTQEEHFEGLPVGTRGGAVVRYTFPLDAEYEIQIRLARDRNEHVEGLTEPHEVELLLDRERVQLFTVTPPERQEGFSEDYQPSHDNIDRHLTVRVPVKAGPHALGVAFLKKPSALLETARQPYQAHFNFYRHPRIQPAVYSISIIGPYAPKGPGETPSRQRLFVSQPASPADEEPAAKRILATLMRRAYRRPVTDADLHGPFELYTEAQAEDGFDAGIEMALVRRAGEPGVPVPRRTGSCRYRTGHRLSHQRSGTGVAALVLPLEQHSGR